MKATRLFLIMFLSLPLGCSSPSEDGATADLTADGAVGDLALDDADAAADSLADDATATADTPANDDASTDDTATNDSTQVTDITNITDTTDAGPAPVTCEGCNLDKQPATNHPGSRQYPEGVDLVETTLGPAKCASLIYIPKGPGPFPVLGFVHGKQLFEGSSGFGTTELGRTYRPLLEHVAKKGYVVVFVRVEKNLLDGDHVRMADDFLGALEAALVLVSKADASKVAYAGHSMGAKVVLIAAAKATTLDTAGVFHDPTLVVPMAVENTPPPFGAASDARDFVKNLPAGQLWVTFLAGAADTTAPWNDPSKPNAKAIYDVLPAKGKQIILLHGSGPADALNPSTSPTLLADHMFPGAIEGKNGGLSDLASPPSHLDALDWYGVWKVLVGALDYHFKDGNPVWAYGELRTHGGTLPDGTVFHHTVEAEQLPAKL
jgi:hypothetical protein